MDSDDRQYFEVTCSKCGEETEVPFQPIEGRKIYCRTCYKKMKRY